MATMNIKSQEAYDLAKRLSRMTGKSMTQVIIEALKEKLENFQKRNGPKARSAKLQAIGKEFAASAAQNVTSSSIDELLYDDQGLFK